MIGQKTSAGPDGIVSEELNSYIIKINNQIFGNPNVSLVESYPIEFRANLVFPITESNKTTAVGAELTGYDDCNYEIGGSPEPIYSTPEYYDERYYENTFSSYKVYQLYWTKIEEYYNARGIKIMLKYDYYASKVESVDASGNTITRGPYNYIQIEKINITLPTKSNLLFLDTEVHDLKSPIIIQLAYKDSDTGENFSEYYSTDGVQISDKAMGVHHITEKMLEGKEVFSKSKDKSILQNILNEKILVAHNAKFDIGVLQSVGMQIPRNICTLKIAHHLYPNLENYKLQTLRYTFKLELEGEINPHDAMSDVLVLEKLFGKFYEELSNKSATTDSNTIIEEMITISSRPILLDTITFGKHKGEKWSNLPKDYLDWILNKSDFRNDEDIAYTCRYYAEGKGNNKLTENMFEKAWKHPGKKNMPAIEEHTEDTIIKPDNQSATKIFGIFLILIVVMVLISVLF